MVFSYVPKWRLLSKTEDNWLAKRMVIVLFEVCFYFGQEIRKTSSINTKPRGVHPHNNKM
jgi:hypothetical protein